jgi:hypothetical protein
MANTTSALAMKSVKCLPRERVEAPSDSGWFSGIALLPGLVVTTAGVGVDHAGARPQHWVLGSEQHLRGFLHRVRVGCRALHGHRLVVELALELGVKHLIGNLDHHRAGLAGAHGVVGAAHQVRQFLHIVRERRPLGHRLVDLGSAEHRVQVLPRQRKSRGDDEKRHVLGVGLRDPGERILDARTGLRGEHAVLLAALDAAVAVGEAHADALLPAQDGADVERRTRLDDRIARIAGEKIGALALEDLSDDLRAVHGTVLCGWPVWGASGAKCRAAARAAGSPPAAHPPCYRLRYRRWARRRRLLFVGEWAGALEAVRA